MTQRYLTILTLFIACSLGACNIFQKSTSGQTQINGAAVRADVQASVPYIRPVAAAACAGVITFGVNPKDRTDIANEVYAVASVVDSFAQGTTPTPDQLQGAISVGTGTAGNAGDYTMIAQALEAVYAGVFPQIKNDPKLALQILGELSAGARDAARAFTTQAAPSPTP